MLIRTLILFLLICTGCSSGIIPCPEVRGLKLKKSPVAKRIRSIDREEPEPVITVSSDARTPQTTSRNRYKYVKYTIQHVDVEELDCPKPGDRKVPKAVKDNVRKNRKKVRYYYEESAADSVNVILRDERR
jgi:hypothetical protein